MNNYISFKDIKTGKIYDVKLPCIIGRGKDVNLRLSDPSISRKHCEVFETKNGIFIRDLGSANGTLVNGNPVAEEKINNGNIITLGSTRLQIILKNRNDHIEQETVILKAVSPDKSWNIDVYGLQLISKMAIRIAELDDRKKIFQEFFDALSSLVHFDHGFLITIDDFGELKIKYPPETKGLPISKTVANQVITSGESLLIQDTLSDSELAVQESIIALNIRSALCIPLKFRKNILGIIYLDRHLANSFSENDLEYARALVSLLGPVMENTRLKLEIEKKYKDTINHLRKVEARLLDMERTAAFSRLAQAVAHEIRNPITICGGFLQKIKPSDKKCQNYLNKALDALQRIDRILKDVDSFVTLSSPKPSFIPIGAFLEYLKGWICSKYTELKLSCYLASSPDTLIYVDKEMLTRAIYYIFFDISQNMRSKIPFQINIKRASDTFVEIVIEVEGSECEEAFIELFSPEAIKTPWKFGLYINMAYKIIADHNGKLLITQKEEKKLPIKIILPLR